jgi:hypothetical protein
MPLQNRSRKRYIVSLPHYEYQHGTGAKILFVEPDYSDVVSPLVAFFRRAFNKNMAAVRSVY